MRLTAEGAGREEEEDLYVRQVVKNGIYDLRVRLQKSFSFQEQAALDVPPPTLRLEVRNHVPNILSGVEEEVVCERSSDQSAVQIHTRLH